MRRAPRRTGSRGRAGIFLIMALAIALVFVLDAQITPMIHTSVESAAQKISAEAVNQAVNEEITENQLTYQKIMRSEKDGNGNITSMDTDMVALNSLKAQINLKIQEKLNALEKQNFSIPAGTLIGSDLFRDRGPKVPLKCTLLSNVLCDIKNVFDSAGINQTRHAIMLEVKTEVRAMIPGYQTTLGLTTNFCVAETIIVGDVPSFYAGLGKTAGTGAAE